MTIDEPVGDNLSIESIEALITESMSNGVGLAAAIYSLGIFMDIEVTKLILKA
jgi:hypothetical protein